MEIFTSTETIVETEIHDKRPNFTLNSTNPQYAWSQYPLWHLLNVRYKWLIPELILTRRERTTNTWYRRGINEKKKQETNHYSFSRSKYFRIHNSNWIMRDREMLPKYYFYWFRIENKHKAEPWLDQALMDTKVCTSEILIKIKINIEKSKDKHIKH